MCRTTARSDSCRKGKCRPTASHGAVGLTLLVAITLLANACAPARARPGASRCDPELLAVVPGEHVTLTTLDDRGRHEVAVFRSAGRPTRWSMSQNGRYVALTFRTAPPDEHVTLAIWDGERSSWTTLFDGAITPAAPQEAILALDGLVARTAEGLVISPLGAWSPSLVDGSTGRALIPLQGSDDYALLLESGLRGFEHLALLQRTGLEIRNVVEPGDRPSETAAVGASGVIAYARPSLSRPGEFEIVTADGTFRTREEQGNVLGITVTGDRPSYVSDRAGVLYFVGPPFGEMQIGPRQETNRATIQTGSDAIAVTTSSPPNGRIFLLRAGVGASDLGEGYALGWRRSCSA